MKSCELQATERSESPNF